jgi:hypothetical protein
MPLIECVSNRGANREWSSGSGSRADYLLPGAEAIAHDLAVMVGRQTVAARTELVTHRTERLQEALRMLG